MFAEAIQIREMKRSVKIQNKVYVQKDQTTITNHEFQMKYV